MIAAIPTDRDEQKVRVAKLKSMETSRVAPLAVYLASDVAAGVSRRHFGVRANEIVLFSQNRPLRSVRRSEGRTPQTISNHAMPAILANKHVA